MTLRKEEVIGQGNSGSSYGDIEDANMEGEEMLEYIDQVSLKVLIIQSIGSWNPIHIGTLFCKFAMSNLQIQL